MKTRLGVALVAVLLLALGAWAAVTTVNVVSDGTWRYVVWDGKGSATGVANAVTDVPVFGYLRQLTYQPPVSAAIVDANSGTLTVDAGWRRPAPLSRYAPADPLVYDKFDDEDTGFVVSEAFGGTNELVLGNTGSILVGYPVFEVTGALDLGGNGANFRIVAVFSEDAPPGD